MICKLTCSVLLLKFRMVSRYVTAVNLLKDLTLEGGRSSLKLKITGTVDNIKNYGLHSLRSGGATASVVRGIPPDRPSKRHGRLRSESAKDGYVKDA